MNILKIASVVLLILIFLLVVLLVYFNFRVQQNPLNKKFLSGKMPDPLPDGFHIGRVGIKSDWKGKKFDAKNSTGINIFLQNGKEAQVYPFKTYPGKGLSDAQLNVLKIDYNIPQNSWYLRLILDEIVETAPNAYLGKLHLRLLPGLSVPLGFFSLTQ